MLTNSLSLGIENIKNVLRNLLKSPGAKSPGVYQMINKKGEILYVGKAKNLYSRVSSYTQVSRLPHRIKRMVSEVAKVEVLTTNSEVEALLLECNLIKHLRPPYNILFKDGKSYAYLRISKNHSFPRLTKFRGKTDNQGDYFGPYPFGGEIDEVLVTLQKIFRLRNCSDEEFARRKRPCLQYDIGRCSAPCMRLIEPKDYQKNVMQAKKVLLGKIDDVQKDMAQKMQMLSQDLNFEKAAVYRDQITIMTKMQKKQNVYLQGIEEADVLIVHENYIKQLIIRSSLNLGMQSFKIDHLQLDKSLSDDLHVLHSDQNIEHGQEVLPVDGDKIFEDLKELSPDHGDKNLESNDLDSDVLFNFISQFYIQFTPPKEIILQELPDGDLELLLETLKHQHGFKPQLVCPKTGPKKALLDFAMRQAENQKNFDNDTGFKDLQEVLGLSSEIKTIEVYDNSHLQGTHAYGVMISVDEKGFDYKKFQIKQNTNDDYSMMREVVARRLQHKEWAYPAVMLIDGGCGQVSVVNGVVEHMCLDIVVLGIAKGEKRNAGNERFYLPDREIFVPKRLRYFLQRIRDEAHRFAIKTHKHARGKGMKSKLDEIEGIGPKRKKILLHHFGSLENLAEARLDELQLIKGISKSLASSIWQFFRDK